MKNYLQFKIMFLPITVINDPTLVAVDPIQVQSCKVHKVGIWVQYLRNIFLFTFPFFIGICLNEKHLDTHLPNIIYLTINILSVSI